MLKAKDKAFAKKLGFDGYGIVLEDCAHLVEKFHLKWPEQQVRRSARIAKQASKEPYHVRRRRYDESMFRPLRQYNTRSKSVQTPSPRKRAYIEDEDEDDQSTSSDSGVGTMELDMDTDDEVLAMRARVAKREEGSDHEIRADSEQESEADPEHGVPSIEPLVEDGRVDRKKTRRSRNNTQNRFRPKVIRMARSTRRDPERCPCKLGTKKYFLHNSDCAEGLKIQEATVKGLDNASGAVVTVSGEATKVNAVMVTPTLIYNWRDVFLNVLHIHDLVSTENFLLDLNIDEFTQLVVLTDILFVCIQSSAAEYFKHSAPSVMQLVRISDCLEVIATYNLDVSVFPGDVIGGFFGSGVFALHISHNFVDLLKVYSLSDDQEQIVELGEHHARTFNRLCFPTLMYPMTYGFPIASRGCPDFAKMIQHNLCTQEIVYLQLKNVPKLVVVPDVSTPSIPHAWAPTRFFAYVGYLDGSTAVICLDMETLEWKRLPISFKTPVRRLLYTAPNVLLLEARCFKKLTNPTMAMHRFAVGNDFSVTPLPNILDENGEDISFRAATAVEVDDDVPQDTSNPAASNPPEECPASQPVLTKNCCGSNITEEHDECLLDEARKNLETMIIEQSPNICPDMDAFNAVKDAAMHDEQENIIDISMPINPYTDVINPYAESDDLADILDLENDPFTVSPFALSPFRIDSQSCTEFFEFN